jgi:sRNA-binding regulator protein Hfq
MGSGKRPKYRPKTGRPAPRTPPEESTGGEASYLFRKREKAAPVVVLLEDGTEHRGVIEYFDRDVIKLVRPEGPGLLLRKTEIRYIADTE